MVIAHPEYLGGIVGLALAGAALLARGLCRRRRWVSGPGWRTAHARVIGADRVAAGDLLGPGGDAGVRAARLAYAYRAGGREYVQAAAGWHVEADYPGRAGVFDGRALRAGEVEPGFAVRYDPDRPEHCVPEWHLEWVWPWQAGGGALLLAGAAGLAALATAA